MGMGRNHTMLRLTCRLWQSFCALFLHLDCKLRACFGNHSFIEQVVGSLGQPLLLPFKKQIFFFLNVCFKNRAGLKWITNKDLLYSTGNWEMLCGSLDGRGVWERMDTCICMAESLSCSPETITLLIRYTPIQNSLKKKKLLLLQNATEICFIGCYEWLQFATASVQKHKRRRQSGPTGYPG